jgi:hypothetical protein
MTALWATLDTNEAAAVILVATWFVGSLAACWVWSALWSRCACAVPFTPATEAAIDEALSVAEHVDDNPAAEYAVAALRRDLEEWGRG